MPKINIEVILHDVPEEDINIKVDVHNAGAESIPIISRVIPERKGPMFLHFMQSLIEDLELSNLRTAEAYRHARNHLRAYLSGEDIEIHNFNSDFVEGYELYLKRKKLSLNTISFHLRVLRAVYNKAVERDMTNNLRPFRHVYTGVAKTTKRAISIQELKEIKNYHTTDSSVMYARNMFLFSFYTRGMSFVDMAYLKCSDIHNGWLTYQRQKTGQTIVLKWEKSMEDIVESLPASTPPYLLPIIHSCNGKERNQYRYKQDEVNRNLKIIAQDISLNSNLTMYVTRHSWASIAEDCGLPVNLISMGLGHTTEKTTKIYLETLKQNKIDEANAKIIDLLND
jgi:site-specific recombinase XerD